MDGKAIVAITNWQSILPVFACAYQLPLVGAHAGCVGAESLHIGPVFGSRIALPGKLPIETELTSFSYGANDANVGHSFLQTALFMRARQGDLLDYLPRWDGSGPLYQISWAMLMAFAAFGRLLLESDQRLVAA